MRNTKYLLFKGPMPTLNDKIDWLKRSFDASGITSMVLDLRNEMCLYDKQFKDFVELNAGSIVALSFNNVGINIEKDGINFWRSMNIPFFSWLVDHPRNYDMYLVKPACDLYVITVDENHMQFVKEYYPRVKDAFFVMNGGRYPEKVYPLSERQYDVVYMGANGYKQTGFPPVFELEDRGQSFYEYCVGSLLNDPEQTTESVVMNYIFKRGITDEGLIIDMIFNKSGSIENYVRREFKFRGIRELDSRGIKVDIWGDNWEREDMVFSDNISIHDRVAPELIPEIISDAKIVLCYTPWFKKGCSEKQFDAMSGGAVCVSDENYYLKERYDNGKNIVFFNLKSPSEMADRIADLLDNIDKAETIAMEGMKLTRQGESWLSRANQIDAIISKLFGFQNDQDFDS